MKKKMDHNHAGWMNLHGACKGVIFEALGIGDMKGSGWFIFCWYLAAVFLAVSIRMLRREFSWYSGSIFFLSLFLVVLLTLYGLSWGRFRKESHELEGDNEK